MLATGEKRVRETGNREKSGTRETGAGGRRRKIFWVLFLGALLPNFALADACESQASATYSKKAVEVAMASIVGDISEVEATSQREGLQKRLESEKAKCVHVARSYASSASGSL
jgi:hypothetical protein